MGPPRLSWEGVPLAHAMPLDPLPLDGAPAAVGMGNPHCVSSWPTPRRWTSPGRPRVERDPIFPERSNVEVVEMIDRATLRMRVWERGGPSPSPAARAPAPPRWRPPAAA